MTNNLGDVRHAMASQPSLYSEERKLLRIQAWEQRNQEICQEQKGHPENVPLFGKPYKTSKWDELSCRIQKMLGSYEDGKDPDLNSGNFVKDLLGSSSNHASIMATLNQRQLTPAHASTKPSFHGGPRPASTSTPTQTLARPQHGAEAAAAAASQPSPGYHQEVGRPRSPGQRDEEDLLDMEYARLPAMLATLSPLAEMESPLHSSDGDPFGHSRDADHQGAFDLGAESPQRSLVSPIRPMEMPEPKPPTKGGPAAPQTFPPPLAAGVVVTKKPTAYVRPMDGQDQVIMESPELKPSPEPYEPLPDKKNNNHHHPHHHNNINNNNATLSKSLPRSLEPRPNDAQCVEDILREMTHSWPPLLTTIQTPSASQTPRSPPAAKVVERVQIKHPEHYDSPPTESPVSSQQSSACTVEAAHSSGVESASSSDSESSSASESENDSARRRPLQRPPSSSPAEVKTPAPHGDWQLANWIRSGQQSTGGASKTPPHKPPPPSQRSSGPRDAAATAAAAAAAAATHPPRDYKLHVSSDQEGSSHSQVAKPQQCRGVPLKHPAQPAVCKSPARPKAPDAAAAAAATAAGRVKPVCKKHSAKPGRTLSPKPPKAAPQAETTRPGPAEDKSSSPSLPLTFSYRPKVKTKTKRSSGGPKTERASLPRQEDTSTCVPKAPVSAPPCHCGRSPDRCVCLAAPSPGGPDRALAAPSAEASGGCASVKKEPAKRPQGPKKAPKTVKPEAVQPPPGKPATAARSLVPSLLVKIDLSLLCRVPFVSAVAQETTTTTTIPTTSSSSSSNSTTTIPTNSATNNNTTTTGTPSTSTSSNSRGKGASETGGKGSDPSKWGPTKNNKRGPAESDKNPPKKRQKMEKKAKVVEQLPGRATVKSESSVIVVKEEKQKTAKKRGVPQSQQQHCSGPKEHSTEARHGKDSNPKHKKSTKKHKEHAKTGKKGPKSMLTVQASAEPSRGGSRPMLRFEDRLYPVKHYIKEAKKLKHKADAESDKVSKAFGYLEAAMFFAESGVAMETELETSKSPYSMYEDTVELIKFTLKQKNSGDSSALPSENDFTVLCLKCQSFLQMAMFRCKQKVASKYSKTLKTHFMNCKPSLDASLGSSRSADAASPRSFAASPALAAPGSTTSSSSSGPGSNHSCGGGEGSAAAAGSATSNTVSIPKIIHHVAFSYVNITALFVSAHDLWEKAEALTHKSSGVLSELNGHMEPLSLSSSVKAMVQYTRQALHWLRLNAQSLK